MSIRKRLEQHLIAGEDEQVLRALTVLADQMGDNTLMNDVVYQHTRYRQLLREQRSDELAPAELKKRQTQIRQVLWMVIRQLPE